jgi:hypothetical protein
LQLVQLVLAVDRAPFEVPPLLLIIPSEGLTHLIGRCLNAVADAGKDMRQICSLHMSQVLLVVKQKQVGIFFMQTGSFPAFSYSIESY